MQEIVRQVEEVSGLPVIVQADPTLTVMATARAARGGAAAHLVAYKPSLGPLADYLIGFQCGYLLRTYSLPPEERYDLAGTWRGRTEAGKLVAKHLRHQGLAPAEAAQARLRDQMYDGLIRQLRSVPVGLRVDERLRRGCPDLAGRQRDAVLVQLRENMATLAPDVRRLTPPKVFEASVSMNAAFAAYWARELGDATQAVPYRAAGLLAAGEALLRDFADAPHDPAGDRGLIDAWGNRLGLAGWYEFVPFQ